MGSSRCAREYRRRPPVVSTGTAPRAIWASAQKRRDERSDLDLGGSDSGIVGAILITVHALAERLEHGLARFIREQHADEHLVADDPHAGQRHDGWLERDGLVGGLLDLRLQRALE